MTVIAFTPADVVDPELHASGEVYGLWRWMRRHAPVHWHEPGDLPGFWSLTRYEDIRDVYQNPAVFSSARGVLLRPTELGEDPGSGLTMALTDPPRHRALRGQVADRFSERCARSLADEMRAEIRSVVTRAVASGTCDVVHDIGARLSSHNIGRLLGVPPKDRERLLRWTTEAFESGRPLTSHLMLMRYFIDLMYARMEAPADDAMGMFVNNEVQDDLLTETEILLGVENLVGASENAGLSMASGILALAAHPRQWQRLVRERDDELVRTAAEEVLRWTSSATHSMRTATTDTRIQGRRIAAGDRVVLWIPSANRDESVFPEPDRFDLGRQPNRHLALGTGEHVCIGSTMARHQTRMLLETLAESVAVVEPAGDTEPLRSITVNGPAHATVRLVAR
ncbi:cytochrome P450 [Streptomyces sp. NBC_00487]|uniref:cytochrome P450 n=1 Tax=unclassified Streptomyces TaxID=2593676 RepID=UPI002DDC04CA|nr:MULTISPECIES: cytochrome P450 [unclassified Streptomyces]WRY93389.1 cytochrome P450 [Streptomyces sp. NBC_00481]